MAVDLFNNISNDYIYPNLPPCPGMGDEGEYTFEFLPNEQVGVISGSDIVASMGLGDISQIITGWIQQTKRLEPGEVVFIPGMTKGISQRSQYFPFTEAIEYTGANHPYYMNVDISLNYYVNFKHYDITVSASGDADNYVTIANAFNLQFDASNIDIEVTYDPSGLTFTGKNVGYMFDVYNVFVTVDEPDTSIGEDLLEEDLKVSVPSFKYPSGGMLGYVLKVTYPNIAADPESYVMINHVPDFLEYFEKTADATLGPTDATLGACYRRYYKAVDVGANKVCVEDGTRVMTAGDYLHYVDTHNKWEKVGPIRIWLTAPDPVDSNIKNLITGFYVFNPQTFPVHISYMTIL